MVEDISTKLKSQARTVWLLKNNHHAYLLLLPNTKKNQVTISQQDKKPVNLSLTTPAGQEGFFVLAALPFQLKSFAELNTVKLQFIKLLQQNAFNYVTNSWVSYKYLPHKGLVKNDYHLQLKNMLTSNHQNLKTILTLLPPLYIDARTKTGLNKFGQKLLLNSDKQVVTNADAKSWTTRLDAWSVSKFNAINQLPFSQGHLNPYLLYNNKTNYPVYYYAIQGPLLTLETNGFTVRQVVPPLLPVLPKIADNTAAGLSFTIDGKSHDTVKPVMQALLNRMWQGGAGRYLRAAVSFNLPGNSIKSDGGWLQSNAELMGLATYYQWQPDDKTLANYVNTAYKHYFVENPFKKWQQQPRYMAYLSKAFNLLMLPEHLTQFGPYTGDNMQPFANLLTAGNLLATWPGISVQLQQNWQQANLYGRLMQQYVDDLNNPNSKASFLAIPQSAQEQYQCSNGVGCQLATSSIKRQQYRYPYQRNCDPYVGVCWSVGLSTLQNANPSVHSAYAMFNWLQANIVRASLSNEQALFVQSIAQWSLASNAYAHYWLDMDGYYRSIKQFRDWNKSIGNFISEMTINQLAAVDLQNRSNADPEAIFAMAMAPADMMRYISSYQPDYFRHQYNLVVNAARSSAGSPWHLQMDRLESMFDADAALQDYHNALKGRQSYKGGKIHQQIVGLLSVSLGNCYKNHQCLANSGIAKSEGTTFADIYYQILLNRVLGLPNPDVFADSPYAAAYHAAGRDVYYAYWPPRSDDQTAKTVHFYKYKNGKPSLVSEVSVLPGQLASAGMQRQQQLFSLEDLQFEPHFLRGKGILSWRLQGNYKLPVHTVVELQRDNKKVKSFVTDNDQIELDLPKQCQVYSISLSAKDARGRKAKMTENSLKIMAPKGCAARNHLRDKSKQFMQKMMNPKILQHLRRVG